MKRYETLTRNRNGVSLPPMTVFARRDDDDGLHFKAGDWSIAVNRVPGQVWSVRLRCGTADVTLAMRQNVVAVFDGEQVQNVRWPRRGKLPSGNQKRPRPQ